MMKVMERSFGGGPKLHAMADLPRQNFPAEVTKTHTAMESSPHVTPFCTSLSPYELLPHRPP